MEHGGRTSVWNMWAGVSEREDRKEKGDGGFGEERKVEEGKSKAVLGSTSVDPKRKLNGGGG